MPNLFITKVKKRTEIRQTPASSAVSHHPSNPKPSKPSKPNMEASRPLSVGEEDLQVQVAPASSTVSHLPSNPKSLSHLSLNEEDGFETAVQKTVDDIRRVLSAGVANPRFPSADSDSPPSSAASTSFDCSDSLTHTNGEVDTASFVAWSHSSALDNINDQFGESGSSFHSRLSVRSKRSCTPSSDSTAAPFRTFPWGISDSAFRTTDISKQMTREEFFPTNFSIIGANDMVSKTTFPPLQIVSNPFAATSQVLTQSPVPMWMIDQPTLTATPVIVTPVLTLPPWQAPHGQLNPQQLSDYGFVQHIPSSLPDDLFEDECAANNLSTPAIDAASSSYGNADEELYSFSTSQPSLTSASECLADGLVRRHSGSAPKEQDKKAGRNPEMDILNRRMWALEGKFTLFVVLAVLAVVLLIYFSFISH